MIFVECNLDTYLVKSLGFSRKKINHQVGKGNVVRSLRRFPGNKGIIDEDPGRNQPDDLKNYVEIITKGNIKLLKRKNLETTKLVIISDYLEDLIVKRAQQNQINLKEYGLKPDPIYLHDIPHLEKKTNFQKLLNRLIEIDEEIKILKSWLSNG